MSSMRLHCIVTAGKNSQTRKHPQVTRLESLQWIYCTILMRYFLHQYQQALLHHTAICRWYMSQNDEYDKTVNALVWSIILLMNFPAIYKWFCIMEIGFISYICEKWHQFQGEYPTDNVATCCAPGPFNN
jgi:hypothetical protein